MTTERLRMEQWLRMERWVELHQRPLSVAGAWAFIAGYAIAIIGGIWWPENGSLLAVLVLLGLAVGLLNVTHKETTPYLIAAIALVLIGSTQVFTPLNLVADGLGERVNLVVRMTWNARGIPDIDPAVSPDGRWLAFSSRRSGDFEIWAIDLRWNVQTMTLSRPMYHLTHRRNFYLSFGAHDEICDSRYFA